MSADIYNNLFWQGLAQIYSTQTYPTIQVLEVGRSPHLAEPGASYHDLYSWPKSDDGNNGQILEQFF